MSTREINKKGEQYAKVGNILKNTYHNNKDLVDQSNKQEQFDFSETFQDNPVKRMLYSEFIKKNN